MTSRFEARAATSAAAVLAGAGVASVASPSIEEFLNYWVTAGAIGGVSATAVYIGARSLWLSLMIEWECRRDIRPGEISPEVDARIAEVAAPETEAEVARDA